MSMAAFRIDVRADYRVFNPWLNEEGVIDGDTHKNGKTSGYKKNG